ncbi:DNA recombination protein RmuC [Lysobacter sp. KIS68-7]|uniref:DNA recombination protein RmuC n=1 Tax=Lysobacter sp. KIS68-7 TaxID=2904252 RepID=UPI001E52E1F0|nr:DNA recombination protein RmuC [Lysobacter sp. KIS68-7]UHQ20476.1 DNA recombination protein RmuC [Lysobacter sp. KIS68-7]
MTMTLIVACVFALALGLAVGALLIKPKPATGDDTARIDAQMRTAALEGELQARAGEREELRAEIARLRERARDDATAIERARAEAEQAQRARAETEAFVRNAQNELSAKFTELAGKAFHERGQQFEQNVRVATGQSKADIELMLKPFADQLGAFRQRIDTVYGEESKERASLFGAVQELKTLNQDMATQASALARALKGNAKVRGDWGELMLESVLRSSGLEEGAHYERQHSSTDDEGRRLRPDIVIRLPGDRCVVVDSKVNLVAWEEAMNAETPEAQQEALRRHAVGLRQHVRDLADRNYPKALGDSALDVTVAFVPIEGALSAALGFDGELQSEAFGKGVVFASPNTLMAVLRVVERLWTKEKLQKQALEISKTGGLLLDSVINFLADFASVGTGLEDAAKAYRSARDRLEDSTQAVIPRARRLVELGVKGKKKLPTELLPDEIDLDPETLSDER